MRLSDPTKELIRVDELGDEPLSRRETVVKLCDARFHHSQTDFPLRISGR